MTTVRDRIRERNLEFPAEKPDPTPVEIPGAGQRPESLEDMMKRMIVTALSDYKEAAGDDDPEEDIRLLREGEDAEESLLTGYTVLESEGVEGDLTMSEAVKVMGKMVEDAERQMLEEEKNSSPEDQTAEKGVEEEKPRPGDSDSLE